MSRHPTVVDASSERTGLLRVLIVEDEPPARRHLAALLDDADDVVVVGECGDGASAVAMIGEVVPDVVLLDIQIPGMGGFEVVDAIGRSAMPAVIFVTAYDEFAVRAFDIHAVDYVLKPVSAARLGQALVRARDAVRSGTPREELAAVLAAIRGSTARERIPVRDNGRIILVPTADVRYIEAEGAYLRIHTAGRSWLIRERMNAMEERLAGSALTRVHRSLIVNREHVRELEPLYRGEYVLFLADGTRLVSGRTYRQRVHEAFQL